MKVSATRGGVLQELHHGKSSLHKKTRVLKGRARNTWRHKISSVGPPRGPKKTKARRKFHVERGFLRAPPLGAFWPAFWSIPPPKVFLGKILKKEFSPGKIFWGGPFLKGFFLPKGGIVKGFRSPENFFTPRRAGIPSFLKVGRSLGVPIRVGGFPGLRMAPIPGCRNYSFF